MTEYAAGGLVSDRALERYIEAVTERLGEIPDRDDAVDELRAHLGEVRAEHAGMALRDVLGEPEVYADELRAAAGLPPYSPRRTGPAARFSSFVGAMKRHAPVFLMDLRAFWWGVRGLALGLFVFAVIPAVRFAVSENEYFGMWGYSMSPRHVFSVVASAWGSAPHMTVLATLLLVGVALSVWLGGVLSRGAGTRWLSTLVGVVGVLLGVWFAGVLWALVTAGVGAQLDEFIQNGFPPSPF